MYLQWDTPVHTILLDNLNHQQECTAVFVVDYLTTWNEQNHKPYRKKTKEVTTPFLLFRNASFSKFIWTSAIFFEFYHSSRTICIYYIFWTWNTGSNSVFLHCVFRIPMTMMQCCCFAANLFGFDLLSVCSSSSFFLFIHSFVFNYFWMICSIFIVK